MGKEQGTPEEKQLPPVEDGELATVRDIEVLSKKTRPPTPYTEGTLIEDMRLAAKYVENADWAKLLRTVSGLGTGATRAAILEDLKRHQLLQADKKYIVSTEEGRAMIDFLPEALYDIAVTARWEAALDLISEGKADQAAFEQAIVEQVQGYIELLKTMRVERPAQTGGSMSDATERDGSPTEKMLGYAEKLAAATGAELPGECRTSYNACRAFLDANKDVPLPPSAKALEYAGSLASKKGIEVPAEVSQSSKACSAFIDANK